jgi:hypothetical protein
MDLSTLQTRLRERIGNPDTTDVPNATLTLRINEALVDILDKFTFHAAKTTDSSIVTVDDTESYALPAGVDVLINVRDTTNGVKLRKMDRNEYDELVTSTLRTNAKPTAYFRDLTYIYLDPIPDGAYTIKLRYRKATTELSASGDTPTIPVSWHHGIVLLARVKHYEVKEDWPKALAAQSAFDSWVSTKSDEIAEEAKVNEDFKVRLPQLETGLSRLDFDHAD